MSIGPNTRLFAPKAVRMSTALVGKRELLTWLSGICSLPTSRFEDLRDGAALLKARRPPDNIQLCHGGYCILINVARMEATNNLN